MNFIDSEKVDALIKSGIFDENWYLQRYPDVKLIGMDAAEHYVWIGAELERLPSATHTHMDYLTVCGSNDADSSVSLPVLPSLSSPDASAVAAMGNGSLALDPLHSIGALCRGSLFDGEGYLERNPDIAATSINPFEHFVRHGLDEGRSGTFFDQDWYLAQHKDVKLAGVNGFEHFLKSGRKEKRSARLIEIKSVIENGSDYFSNKEYRAWANNFDYPGVDEAQYKACSAKFAYRPKISIIMPVYKTGLQHLSQAIDSVLEQSYDNLELCIADDCSQDDGIVRLLEKRAKADKRVKILFREQNGHISEASNSALALATGDFIGLLDHDDLLHRNALFWMVEALNLDRSLDLIYSDEDKIGEDGERYDPHFKSDFNYELLLTQNMISHFAIYRASIVSDLGGFRRGFEGSQDYDLTLRFIERSSNVWHVPRVLYHWRAIEGSTALAPGEKTYTDSASIRALKEHTERSGKAATVTSAPELSQYFRVRFDLIGSPKVSILIPTKDKIDLVDQCIKSITDLSTYKNYEIIIIDNGSIEKESAYYFSSIAEKGVKVVTDNRPFNYSRINNVGFSHAGGDFVCLMNNDIEILSSDWMEEMLSFAQWDDVGCVGARLWYPDDKLQHGGVIVGLGGVAGHSHKYLEKGHAGYFGRAVLPQALSAVTAACLMVKASIYHEVGGLDEGLSVAFNDIDFCLRVRNAGYRNVWTPYAEMYHHESASRGTEDTPEKQARFKGEVDFMKARWGDTLAKDPYYSPNLTIEREDFSLAKKPRIYSIQDIA